jgi:hypothetical protein
MEMSICAFFVTPEKTDCGYGICVFMEPDPDSKWAKGNKNGKREENHVFFKELDVFWRVGSLS